MKPISKTAIIGKNVKIGKFVTFYGDVEIGDNCTIESYCELGYPNGRKKKVFKIDANSDIKGHSILPRPFSFEDRFYQFLDFTFGELLKWLTYRKAGHRHHSHKREV